MTNADNIMRPQHLGQIRQTSGSGLIQKYGFESRITVVSNSGIGRGLRSLSVLVVTVFRVPTHLESQGKLGKCQGI